mmetsp:Transcript_21942/g.47914  ORF Transcript_21942/g.47914 Transcript_21942/m.47914 type:complete len:93 (-) Transcript_21942:423-701(-)
MSLQLPRSLFIRLLPISLCLSSSSISLSTTPLPLSLSLALSLSSSLSVTLSLSLSFSLFYPFAALFPSLSAFSFSPFSSSLTHLTSSPFVFA